MIEIQGRDLTIGPENNENKDVAFFDLDSATFLNFSKFLFGGTRVNGLFCILKMVKISRAVERSVHGVLRV